MRVCKWAGVGAGDRRIGRPGETTGEVGRRGVRREAEVLGRFSGGAGRVIVGWGAGSVEEFLRSYPEYGSLESTDGEAGETVEQ